MTRPIWWRTSYLNVPGGIHNARWVWIVLWECQMAGRGNRRAQAPLKVCFTRIDDKNNHDLDLEVSK
jgi:hypothetical protein